MTGNRVIGTAAIITVATGSVNSIAKYQKLPSSRFLIGSGVAFLLLSALAEVSEEVAKALAVAVCITVILGEGDGVLSYINTGEINTKKKPKGYTPDMDPGDSPPTNYPGTPGVRPAVVPSGLTMFPGLPNLTTRPQG